jgi:dihydrofolate synthase / folylpolyglutamate synthase
MNYDEALEYVLSYTNYEKAAILVSKFNLERVRRFLNRLSDPDKNFPSIMVAGTKGKGSTSVLMASALQAAGYKVGLYTQPHLYDYRERFQINRQLIPKKEFAALVTEMRPVIEQSIAEDDAKWGTLTAYEIKTGLTLLYFARQSVDIAVLEIGLGGRLDAVNVVTPLVSVITSISYDHMHILGDTLDKIAFEKAGIIKPGVPCLTVPQAPEAAKVFAEVCRERNAPLIVVEPTESLPDARQASLQQRIIESQRISFKLGDRVQEAELKLLGQHQRLNAALAALALWEQQFRPGGLKIGASDVAAGFGSAVWETRLEIVLNEENKPLILADGAHNAASAAYLRDSLQEAGRFYYTGLWYVLGIYKDKDIDGIFRELAQSQKLHGIIFTKSHAPRCSEANELASRFRELLPDANIHIEITPDVPAGLQRARELAQPLDLICATGSLSVAAEAVVKGDGG